MSYKPLEIKMICPRCVELLNVRCVSCGNETYVDPLGSDETQIHGGKCFTRDRDGHELYLLFCPYCGKRVRN